MEKIYYNKLIRDRIPEIIEAAGKRYQISVLTEEEYVQALRKKVVEEAEEVKRSTGGDLVKEIADLFEVVSYLMAVCDVSPEEVEKMRSDRHEMRGGFDKRLNLIWSERKSGSE
jgi:predicted house-cleaning noncanonical NTP pyrophosphatase (MazG superfamily)